MVVFTFTNIILLIVTCITPFIAIAGSIMFIIYFQAKTEKFRGWPAKIIITITLTLAILSTLLIPFDVANTKSNEIGSGGLVEGSLDFAFGVVFQIYYAVVILITIVVIPFSVIFYETEDPDKSIIHQFKWAAIVSIPIILFSIAAIVTLYIFIGEANIPVKVHSTTKFALTLNDAIIQNCEKLNCLSDSKEIYFKPTIFVYIVGLVNIVGWIIFLIFGGCGLTALPIECIKAFIFRPKRITSQDFLIVKEEVKRKSEKMIEIGHKLQEAHDDGKLKGAKSIKLVNDFKKASLSLEEQWKRVNTSFYKGGSSILWSIIQLFLGFLCVIISLVWILHIIIYLILPAGYNFGFLNYVLKYVDLNEFPFFGSIIYVFLTLYLILCVITGASRIASKIPYIAVHEMKPFGTYMNSMLIFSGLFLIASLTITQFTADAFSQYIATSSLDVMYQVIIKNLKYLKYFYICTNYIFLGFSIIGLVLSILFIKNRQPDEDELDKAIDKIMFN